jgi:hypothetical protein
MADQTYTPPTLVSELKRLLGKRNLEKYFADDDGTILNGYVYNGIHALARKRQFWVKTSLTFDVPTNIVPIPANILLLKIVWKDDRTIRCLPTKSYEIYPGDHYFEWFEDITDRRYPGDEYKRDYGDFRVYPERKEIEFFAALATGCTWDFFGFGIPVEADLIPDNRRHVMNHALGNALVDLTPEMLAQRGFQVEGLEVASLFGRYNEEGRKLINKFNDDAKEPYIGVTT